MTALATRTIQQTNPLSIFQTAAERDRTAVKDCIESYGNFIQALARKFTASREEAEATTQEIFLDIWRYADRLDKNQSPEKLLTALIARRRLVKYLQ